MPSKKSEKLPRKRLSRSVNARWTRRPLPSEPESWRNVSPSANETKKRLRSRCSAKRRRSPAVKTASSRQRLPDPPPLELPRGESNKRLQPHLRRRLENVVLSIWRLDLFRRLLPLECHPRFRALLLKQRLHVRLDLLRSLHLAGPSHRGGSVKCRSKPLQQQGVPVHERRLLVRNRPSRLVTSTDLLVPVVPSGGEANPRFDFRVGN